MIDLGASLPLSLLPDSQLTLFFTTLINPTVDTASKRQLEDTRLHFIITKKE